MVSIEKVERKGREYYRLVHTFRKDGRIVHRRKYIGTMIPSSNRLETLKKEFLSEIQKGRFKYFSQEDVRNIEERKNQYSNELKKLSPLEEIKRVKEFIIRFTYDSSKLSGVDVTLRQTYLILQEGIIPRDIKNLRTVKELENHERGVQMLTTYKGVFNIKFMKKLHTVLMKGVDDSIAGKTRDDLKRNVKLAGTSYVPPSWSALSKELKMLFKWYHSESRKLHPVELSALIHLKIISLQPFVDGNSRLSRLLMNWVLWKKKYPPIDIPIEELERYYAVLDLFQIEKNERPFVEYIKERYLKSFVLV